MTTDGLYVEEITPDGFSVRTPAPLTSSAGQIDAAVGVGGSWVLDLGLCALLGVGPVQA